MDAVRESTWHQILELTVQISNAVGEEDWSAANEKADLRHNLLVQFFSSPLSPEELGVIRHNLEQILAINEVISRKSEAAREEVRKELSSFADSARAHAAYTALE